MKTKGQERRRYQRIKIEIHAKVDSGEEVLVSGYTRDLSLKGFFIKSDKKIPVGTRCRAVLLLEQKGEEVQVKADGVVVRHDKPGFAVELTKIDLDSITFIFWFFMVHRMLEDKKK